MNQPKYHLWSEPHGHAFCGRRVRKGPYHATKILNRVTCGLCKRAIRAKRRALPVNTLRTLKDFR